MTYEVGSSVTVRALHQMPVQGPEGELHAHDYRIDVVVGRHELDEHGMVCDLDALRAALQAIVARIDGRDLESSRPPSAEAVTVEVLARWAHRAGPGARQGEGHHGGQVGSRPRTSAATPGRWPDRRDGPASRRRTAPRRAQVGGTADRRPAAAAILGAAPRRRPAGQGGAQAGAVARWPEAFQAVLGRGGG